MAEVVLWHISFSNFNEKVRWALDFKRVPHVRRACDMGLHPPLAMALTRGRNRTFPVLKIDGRAIGDSTRIIEELERRFPDPPLYPADADERRRALELEDFFDEHFGHEIRRLAFWHLMADDTAAAATARELGGGRAARLSGVLRRAVWRYYGIDEDSARRAHELIIAALDRIEAERAGRDYLAGDRFSVADLTAAALAGPLFLPPEFPWRPRGELSSALLGARDELARHPAVGWIHSTYARHRVPVPRPAAAAPA